MNGSALPVAFSSPPGATTTVVLGQIATPLGLFGAALTPFGLGRLTFPAEPFANCESWLRRQFPGVTPQRDSGELAALAEQLTAYLDGSLRQFSVPLDLRGTPFQLAVWQALQGIGYGDLRSYAAIATAVGRPTAVRAVGAANGANPVPILVPCHRVIGSNGTLTGYGGGMELKSWLLQREGITLPPLRSDALLQQLRGAGGAAQGQEIPPNGSAALGVAP